MMLSVNGLRIAADGLTTQSVYRDDSDAPTDIVWNHTWVDQLPSVDEARIRVEGEIRSDGIWTRHSYPADDGRCYSSFVVAPNGRTVNSRALPEVDNGDLVLLFLGPVMRTILYRLDVPSFHAAALVKDGGAVLLMGEKKAGKSTLTFGMQQGGWTTFTDDLVRVCEVGESWHAFAGCRHVKVNASVAEAFGYEAERRVGRGKGPIDDDERDRVLLPPRPLDLSAPTSVSLRAVCILRPRDATLDRPRCIALPKPSAIAALFSHSTPDPLRRQTKRPSSYERAVSGLVRQAAFYDVTVPDRLEQLSRSAEFIEAAIGW